MLKICRRCNKNKDNIKKGYLICYDCRLSSNRERYHNKYKLNSEFKEARNLYNKQHRLENANKYKEYRIKNRERILKNQRAYRARIQPILNKKESDQRLLNKIKLINLFGGACEKCGYNKYHGALDFHHKNPQEKSFLLSKKFGIRSQEGFSLLVSEAEKCSLLCSNCHRETHNLN